MLSKGCGSGLGDGPLNGISMQSLDQRTASMLSLSGGGGVDCLRPHVSIIAFLNREKKNVRVSHASVNVYFIASVTQAGQQHHSSANDAMMRPVVAPQKAIFVASVGSCIFCRSMCSMSKSSILLMVLAWSNACCTSLIVFVSVSILSRSVE